MPFKLWLTIGREKRVVIVVDGKTMRGSAEHKAYHVVSAFVAENQITLGEIAVTEKTNEITADTMSCHKKIIDKIGEKRADYVIALKENQPCIAMLHYILKHLAKRQSE